MATPKPVPNKWLDAFRKKASAEPTPDFKGAPSPLQVVHILAQPHPPMGYFKSDKASYHILPPDHPDPPIRETQVSLTQVITTISKVVGRWGQYIDNQSKVTQLIGQNQAAIEKKLGIPNLYKLIRSITSQSLSPLVEDTPGRMSADGMLWTYPSSSSRFAPSLGVVSEDMAKKIVPIFSDFSATAKTWVPAPGVVPLLCYTYVEMKRPEPNSQDEIRAKLYNSSILCSLIPDLRSTAGGISSVSFPSEINLYHYFYHPMVVIRPSGTEDWSPRPLGPGCFRLHTHLDIYGSMHQRGILAGYPAHNHDFFHPHAETSGGCCLGHYKAEALGGLSNHHDLGIILDLFSGYLTHANNSGAYGGQAPCQLRYALSEEELTQLSAICGDDLPPNWLSLSRATLQPSPDDEDEDDDTRLCVECENSFDVEDLYTCSGCGEWVCPECSHEVYDYRPGRGCVERGRWCNHCIEENCTECTECGEYYVNSAVLECDHCGNYFCNSCDANDHIIRSCADPNCGRMECKSCAENNKWVQSKTDSSKWYCPDHAPSPDNDNDEDGDEENEVEPLPKPDSHCYSCGKLGAWEKSLSSDRVFCPDCIVP